MSSLPSIRPSTSRETYRRGSKPNASSSSAHEHDAAPELKSTPDQDSARTGPATRSTSHQRSESSNATMLGAFFESGTFDNASSVTLQEVFPWHKVDANRSTQKIPATIVPDLLHPRFPLKGGESGSRAADQGTSGSEDDVLRYSASQKEKWKAQSDGGIMRDRSPSPPLSFDSGHNSVEDWVIHNKLILQEYADRQTSLPLGRRLEVSIDEPPQFILGAIQLLANRDKRDCTDPSRKLGPQLIENFVDIDRWVKEYFRYRHGTRVMDNDISALLTIVMNNFYEGLVQLIDRLVEFSLERMRVCGRSSLEMEDFAFGFDFRMSQDLPFYVETSSRIREPLPIPVVECRSPAEPVITSSGRQVKPSERAQAAIEQASTNANGRQRKGKNTSTVKDKPAEKPSDPPPRQRKNPTRSSPRRKEALATPAPPETTAHNKYRPIQPSNLGLPPILGDSSPTAEAAPPQSNDNSKLGPSTSVSADSKKVCDSGSNPPTRLKIMLRPPSLPGTAVPATSSSESVTSKSGGSTSWTNPPSDTSEATNGEHEAPRSGASRPRSPRNHCQRAHESEGGRTPLTPTADTREARPDDVKDLPAEHQVDAGDREVSVAADAPATPLAPVESLKGTVDKTSRVQSRGVDRSDGTRDNSLSTPQPSPPRLRTGKLLLPRPDPGHPLRRKRKLDECED